MATNGKTLTSKPVFGSVIEALSIPTRSATEEIERASASVSANQGHRFWCQLKARMHATSCLWIILTYILSRTVSKLSWSVSQLFALTGLYLSLTCHSRWIPELTSTKLASVN